MLIHKRNHPFRRLKAALAAHGRTVERVENHARVLEAENGRLIDKLRVPANTAALHMETRQALAYLVHRCREDLPAKQVRKIQVALVNAERAVAIANEACPGCGAFGHLGRRIHEEGCAWGRTKGRCPACGSPGPRGSVCDGRVRE